MTKEYEVIVSYEEIGHTIYARLEYKGRFTWKTKRTAEKHAREFKAKHKRNAWVSET